MYAAGINDDPHHLQVSQDRRSKLGANKNSSQWNFLHHFTYALTDEMKLEVKQRHSVLNIITALIISFSEAA